MSLKLPRRGAWLVLWLVTAAHANPPPVPASVRRVLGAATVLVLPSRCAGAVVEAPWLVATAKHCIDDGVRLRVRVAGVERDAELVEEDAAADQVVLALASAVPVTPLGVVRRIPSVGTVLYFHGNPERPRWQAARLVRIAPCPSLPDLSGALHTSINGTPGDSGAPLVDLLGEVVGLVHGGAKCRIATPAIVSRVSSTGCSSASRRACGGEEKPIDRPSNQVLSRGGHGPGSEPVESGGSRRGKKMDRQPGGGSTVRVTTREPPHL